MSKPLKVVFDTNIYVSAIIFGGNPRQCLELAKIGEISLFSSKAIFFELAIKLRDKFSWHENDIKEVIEGIRVFASIVSPKQNITLIKEDVDDNRILEAAITAEADYLISGDKKHLLSRRTYKGIPIISAKQFLDIFYGKIN